MMLLGNISCSLSVFTLNILKNVSSTEDNIYYLIELDAIEIRTPNLIQV